jgi:cytidine deaminase
MHLDQTLVDAALSLAAARWPNREAGAAALYTTSGRILTSVFVESPHQSVCLCHETGAICEAHKIQEPITATVCVSREDASSPFVILPPCGVCCERLAYWGGEVEVAVPKAGEPSRWEMRRLREVMPHYWFNGWPMSAEVSPPLPGADSQMVARSPLGISIRRLEGDDSLMAGLLARAFLNQPVVSQEHLQDLLADDRNIVIAALQNESPVGFLIAHHFPSLAGEQLVYLYDIEVSQEHRRTGVSRSMVAALKNLCLIRGVNRIWVGSGLNNSAACALWAATGAARVSDQYVEFVYALDTAHDQKRVS